MGHLTSILILICIITLWKKLQKKNNNRKELRLSRDILTKREIEYLALAALGCANTEISTKLVVSRSTVKKTLETVFRKLKAKNRTHAVSIAFTLGILTSQFLTDVNNTSKVDEWNLHDILEEDKI